MSYFGEEILNGLSKVPTYGCPGTMVILNEKAQAVFTGNTSGEVFLAAAEYANGRIFICAHDHYYYLLDSNTEYNETIVGFINNVKKWLIKSNDLSNLNILDVNDFNTSTGIDLNKYKLVKWCQAANVDEKKQQILLDYLREGGSLFIAVTPWGYLYMHPEKKFSDLSAYNFLKNNFDVIFTEASIRVDSEIDVEKNCLAKYSNFNRAIKKVTTNVDKLSKYCSTLECGLQALKKENIIHHDIVLYLEESLKNEISSKNIDYYPLKDKFIKTEEQKNILKLYCKCLIEKECEKAPYIDDFPGDFDEMPNLLTDVLVNIDAKFKEWVSTGFYLPAGIRMNIKVIEGDADKWMVRIGAHKDDVSCCDGINRWPIVSIKKSLTLDCDIFSPFGGLIYFQSSKADKLTVVLSNVVQSPFFDVLKPETLETWNDHRLNAPGLWAEIAGEHVILTCPSTSIRNLENPFEVVKFWDDVIKCHHTLRGTDPYKYRRERVVNDKQPSAGYMHSGYPIVTHLDICSKTHSEFMFDVNKLKKDGCWGLFHEFGHNLQRDEWTFDGATEVTVNLFSMHCMQYIIGKPITKQTWIMNQKHLFKKYFEKKPTYEDWKNNCHMGIMTFAQLIKHFGWEPMYKFLSDYENDIDNRIKSKLPKNNQEKIDQWVLRYSRIIEHNIKPQFEMWGLPVSESVDEELKDLPKWCPNDEIYPNPENFYNC